MRPFLRQLMRALEVKGENQVEDDATLKSSTLSKINFFLILTLGSAGLFFSNWVSEKIQHAELSQSILNEKIRLIQTQNDENKLAVGNLKEAIKNILIEQYLNDITETVDFSTPSIQDIGNGFMLTRASQEKHLTGIKFKGRILNTQSVRHKNVTFKLTVNKTTKEFTINQISAGNSTLFNVYIPDLEAKDARYAELKYKESTVEYYIK